MFRLRLQRAPVGIAACAKSDEGRNEYGEGEDGCGDSEVHGRSPLSRTGAATAYGKAFNFSVVG